MTEQELRDGEAYQASPSGTAAALVFELERVAKALEAMAVNIRTVNLLMPEIRSIERAAIRLERLQKLFWERMYP